MSPAAARPKAASHEAADAAQIGGATSEMLKRAARAIRENRKNLPTGSAAHGSMLAAMTRSPSAVPFRPDWPLAPGQAPASSEPLPHAPIVWRPRRLARNDAEADVRDAIDQKSPGHILRERR